MWVVVVAVVVNFCCCFCFPSTFWHFIFRVCSSLFSIAARKKKSKGNLGRKGIIWVTVLKLQSTRGVQGRRFMAFSACPHRQPRNTWPRWYPQSASTLPHQPLIKKTLHRPASNSSIWWRQFLMRSFLFPVWPQFVSSCPKNKPGQSVYKRVQGGLHSWGLLSDL